MQPNHSSPTARLPLLTSPSKNGISRLSASVSTTPRLSAALGGVSADARYPNRFWFQMVQPASFKSQWVLAGFLPNSTAPIAYAVKDCIVSPLNRENLFEIVLNNGVPDTLTWKGHPSLTFTPDGGQIYIQDSEWWAKRALKAVLTTHGFELAVYKTAKRIGVLDGTCFQWGTELNTAFDGDVTKLFALCVTLSRIFHKTFSPPTPVVSSLVLLREKHKNMLERALLAEKTSAAASPDVQPLQQLPPLMVGDAPVRPGAYQAVSADQPASIRSSSRTPGGDNSSSPPSPTFQNRGPASSSRTTPKRTVMAAVPTASVLATPSASQTPVHVLGPLLPLQPLVRSIPKFDSESACEDGEHCYHGPLLPTGPLEGLFMIDPPTYDQPLPPLPEPPTFATSSLPDSFTTSMLPFLPISPPALVGSASDGSLNGSFEDGSFRSASTSNSTDTLNSNLPFENNKNDNDNHQNSSPPTSTPSPSSSSSNSNSNSSNSSSSRRKSSLRITIVPYAAPNDAEQTKATLEARKEEAQQQHKAQRKIRRRNRRRSLTSLLTMQNWVASLSGKANHNESGGEGSTRSTTLTLTRVDPRDADTSKMDDEIEGKAISPDDVVLVRA